MARPDGSGLGGSAMRGLWHGGVDRLAMWLEDRKAREPRPFTPCPTDPLRCFGPLGPLPAPPPGAGAWSAPSPRPLHPGDRMALHVASAASPPRGTVVLVPPWKIGSPALVAQYTSALARRGFEVWLVVPPEHMERAAPGRPSGHDFAAPDLRRFRALFEQLVLEVRVAAAMAAARGASAIVGLSLGALASALAITAGSAPRFAALVAPPADLAAVLTETPIGRRYRRLALRAGSRWPEEGELRDALAPFDPRRRPAPSARVLLAVGRYDRVAPPAGALALAAAWGVKPRVYARGHLTLLFACRALRRELAAILAAQFPDGAAPAQARAGAPAADGSAS